MSRRRTLWPQTRDRTLGMVEMLVLAGWKRDRAEEKALVLTIDLEQRGYVIERIEQ